MLNMQIKLHAPQALAPNGHVIECGDVVRQLREWRYQRPIKVPIRLVAKLANLHSTTLHKACNTGFISYSAARKLTPVIEAINKGELRIRKSEWSAYQVIDGVPATTPPRQPIAAAAELQPAPAVDPDTTE